MRCYVTTLVQGETRRGPIKRVDRGDDPHLGMVSKGKRPKGDLPNKTLGVRKET